MKRSLSLSVALVATLAFAACGFEHATSVLAPTSSPSGGGSSPTPNPTSPNSGASSIVGVADDGAHRDFRIDVEHEAAVGAHRTLGLGRLQHAAFERAAAARAEPVRVRVVVRVKMIHTTIFYQWRF